MVDQTADEALAEYKLKLGDDFGELYHHCLQHLWDIVAIWDQHETLFGNQERVDLMNATGGMLAYNIERLFLQGVVSGITRLLDPEQSMGSKGKDNLTLRALPKFCNSPCKSVVDGILAQLESNSSGLREIRNKVLAHNDYSHVTTTVAALEYGTRAEITALLVAMHSILETIAVHHLNSTLGLRPIGNETALTHLHFLQRGQAGRAKELHDFENNRIGWQDFEKLETWLQINEKEENRYK
jgi:AbiU2